MYACFRVLIENSYFITFFFSGEFVNFCRQDNHHRGTVSDENVSARVRHHVHAAHIDIRQHSVLLLYEEMDDSEKNDGIEETHVPTRTRRFQCTLVK